MSGHEFSDADAARLLDEPLDPRPIGIRFRSPSEIVAGAERFAADHPAIWDGYLIPTMVTLLNGRYKGGKSTFAWSIIRALVEGRESFCGRMMPGRSVPVVFLTEEPDVTLAHKVADLPDDLVRVLNRMGLPIPRPPWSDTLADAVLEAERVGAEMLVIDTFAEWAEVADENDARDVQASVEVIRRATDAGLAVLLLHHFRKGWKVALDDGEAGRGSSALFGAANVIVDIAKVEGGDDRDRQLLASSHLPTTPDALVVKWTGEDFTMIAEGERAEARKASQHERVLDVLPVAPPGLKVTEVAEALGVQRPRAQKLLKEAHSALDEIERIGDEHGGYRYWKVARI